MKNFLFAFICLILCGCTRTNKPPKGVMPEDKMSVVLWDMFQAQSWAKETANKDSLISLVSETKVLSDKVFQFHHITQEDFLKSYQWYLKHPDILSTMLDSIYAQKSRVEEEPILKRDFEKPKLKSLKEASQPKLPE